LVLNEVHELVKSAEKALSYCRDGYAELPPALDLSGPKDENDSQDPSMTQFADSFAWDVINTNSDPGSDFFRKVFYFCGAFFTFGNVIFCASSLLLHSVN
jgi:hypothetical protein